MIRIVRITEDLDLGCNCNCNRRNSLVDKGAGLSDKSRFPLSLSHIPTAVLHESSESAHVECMGKFLAVTGCCRQSWIVIPHPVDWI